MKNEFIPVREKLWEELSALAAVEIKTEGQRADECIKSRLFWDWGPVENRLKNPITPWLDPSLTAMQSRIMRAVCLNCSVEVSA